MPPPVEALRAWWNAPDPSTGGSPDDVPRAPLAALVSACIALFVSWSATRWALLDTAPPAWDQARHAWNVLRLIATAREVWPDPLKWADLWVWHDQQYPVGGYIVPAVVQAFTGPSFRVDQLLMAWTWTPLLFACVHALAVRTVRHAWAGPVAVAWTASSPMVLDLCKDFLLDLPVLSAVALATWRLQCTDLLQQRRGSVRAGAAVGLALLVKAGVALTFLAGPVLAGLFAALRARSLGTYTRNALRAGLGAFVVAGPYTLQFASEAGRLVSGQARDAATEGDPTSWLPSALMYARWIPRFHVNALMFALFIGGAWVMWRTRRQVAGWVLGSIALTWMLWPFFPNKDARYPLGWMALGAVAVSALVVKVSPRVLVPLLAAHALFMGVSVHVGIPWLPPSVELGPVVLWQQHGYLRGAPAQQRPLPREVLQEAGALADRLPPTGMGTWRPLVHARLLHDEMAFNGWNLSFEAWAQGRRVQVVSEGVKDETPGPDVSFLVVNACAPVPDLAAGWDTVSSWTTPDGCTARLAWNPARERAVAAASSVTLQEKTTCALGTQARTVERAVLVETGDDRRVVVISRVDANRRPRKIRHRVLDAQGAEVAAWNTQDDQLSTGGLSVSAHALPVTGATHVELSVDGVAPCVVPLFTLSRGG